MQQTMVDTLNAAVCLIVLRVCVLHVVTCACSSVQQDIANAANYPNIRLFTLAQVESKTPLSDIRVPFLDCCLVDVA